MAAKIYSAPEAVGKPPELYIGDRSTIDDYMKACDEWTTRVVAWAKENTRNPKSDLVGYIYRYPVADGYAQYVVLNTTPLELIALPLLDDYEINEITRRGLRVSDIRQAKKFDEAWKSMPRVGQAS